MLSTLGKRNKLNVPHVKILFEQETAVERKEIGINSLKKEEATDVREDRNHFKSSLSRLKHVSVL